MKEIIKQSHVRVKKIGIKVEADKAVRWVAKEDFNQYLRSDLELAKRCLSVFNDFYKLPQIASETILMLVDAEGCVLSLQSRCAENGDCNSLLISEGDYLSEDSFGTSAISLALNERIGFQLSGTEHYLNILKDWNSYASPVFNYNNRFVGVLALFEYGNSSNAYVHGLLNMMSQVVSDGMWNSLIQKQLNDERHYAFNIVNNLSYGLFAINMEQKIHWVNDTACRTLNIRRTKLINQEIRTLIPQWREIKKQLDKNLKINDDEFSLNISTSEEKFIFNAYCVKSLDEQLLGYVVTFRPFSRMLKMLGRYTLNSAYFNFKDILGESEAIKHAVQIGKTAAKSPSTILIFGESGTGKEVFAQSIHNSSNRRNNNFIAINCGAISSTLIESELFGYEEGAFTGALKKGRPGKFELANNGTLFLDEIGEMPIEMQVKLLRAIQEKKVTRVGGAKEISVDVRIIAATNKNLQDEIVKGTFRTDLYYRLSVIPIHLPSVRQRPEDIKILINFFLKQKGLLLSKPIPEIENGIHDYMLTYSWPGNVRELENVIEKIVLFDGNLSIEDLFEVESVASIPPVIVKESEEFTLKTLAQIEKESIESTLKYFDWNISKTAKTLGLGRNTLYDKLKKYQIPKH